MCYIRGGTFDDTSRVKPQIHFWTRSKQPWFVLPDDATVHPTAGTLQRLTRSRSGSPLNYGTASSARQRSVGASFSIDRGTGFCRGAEQAFLLRTDITPPGDWLPTFRPGYPEARN